MPRLLSKSRFLDGLRCPKLLWYRWHRSDQVPPPDPGREHIMNAGRQVGELAWQLFPGGVKIPHFQNPQEAVAATATMLPERVPLFEAAIAAEERLCRVDVLQPALAGRWDLIEVKTGSRVRESHVRDVAFQHDTLSRAGIELASHSILHVNNNYERHGAVALDQLFTRTDVSERIMRLAPYMGQTIRAMEDVVDGPEPDTPIGTRCTTPHPCPLKPLCWAHLPPDNVTELHGGGRKVWRLLDEGRFTMDAVPDAELTPYQRIQKQAVTSGEVHVDKPLVRNWLDQFTYPVLHLDFETVAPAVPAFDGARPYQQIPFQFSVHVQREPEAAPEHREFLSTVPGDPRSALIEALLEAVDGKGTVLAWNMSFEKMVIEDLARTDPAHAPALGAIVERMEDLMAPFASFAVYHPRQLGSCSLKAVLPAVTELDYLELSIADGGAATHSYERAMRSGVEPGEREGIFSDLRAYCRQDTLAMVAILDWLHQRAATG